MHAFTRMSLSRMIPALVAAAALFSVIAVGLSSYFEAASSLREAAEEKFVALVEAHHGALASCLSAIEEDLTVIAVSDIASDALAAYVDGYDALRLSGSISQTIGQINEIATTIASAVEEQGAATQEIARNVQQASSGTHEVSVDIAGVTEAGASTGAAATQVLGAADELLRQSEALRGKAETFLAAIKAA